MDHEVKCISSSLSGSISNTSHMSTTSSMSSSSAMHDQSQQSSTVTHYVHPSTWAATTALHQQSFLSSTSLGLSASARQHSCSSSLLNAHDIFRRLKLRKGKWTTEEENYAKYLVSEFENGTVPDCESGNTLRAFLSRKLHCRPMRISKKFAGKSIGKYVFIARISTSMNNITYENRVKLVELEQAFLYSLTQDINGGIPMSRMMSPGNFSTNGFLGTNTRQAAALKRPTINLSRFSSSNSIINYSKKDSSSAMPSIPTLPPPVTSAASVILSTKKNITAAANTISPSFSLAASSKERITQKPKQQYSSQQQREKQATDKILQFNPNISTSHNNTSSATLLCANTSMTNNIKTEKTTIPSHPSLSVSGSESLLPNGMMSMTDFLAGFDNVNNVDYKPSDHYHPFDTNTSYTTYCNGNSTQQFTECPTTQSFDDLHQFLGKEIPNSTPSVQLPPFSNNNYCNAPAISAGSNNGGVGGSASDAAFLQFGQKKESSRTSYDNLLISDKGLVNKSYSGIVKTSYNCQDNDISGPTQATKTKPPELTSSVKEQNNKMKLDTNISYDDYALFAQSTCNGIRQYYDLSYKLRRPDSSSNNNIIQSKNKKDVSKKASSCLGKRSADASSLDYTISIS